MPFHDMVAQTTKKKAPDKFSLNKTACREVGNALRAHNASVLRLLRWGCPVPLGLAGGWLSSLLLLFPALGSFDFCPMKSFAGTCTRFSHFVLSLRGFQTAWARVLCLFPPNQATRMNVTALCRQQRCESIKTPSLRTALTFPGVTSGFTSS